MKSVLAVGFVAAFAATSAGISVAQEFPSRPITLVNPYAAGGSADLIARTLGEYLGRELGQPVVVENRTGAATAIAATYVADSAPDGYTLILAGSPTFVITPALNPDAGYDGMTDFEFVSMVANVPNLLVVSRNAGINTAQELADRANEAPDTVSFASVGGGSLPHLTGLMFSEEVGAQMLHIPYPGVAPATVDLLAGNVDTGFLNMPALVPHIESGDLIPLAIASTVRSSQLPDVQTMGELGFQDYEMGTYYGVAAPAGTPADVVAKIDAAIGEVMASEDVQSRLEQQGAQITYMPSEEFMAFVEADAATVLDLIEKSGVETAQ